MISLLPDWWLIFTPLFFVPLIYLFRRRAVVVTGLAVFVCVLSIYTTTQIPREEVFILGRSLLFTDVWAYIMILLFAATACFFILSVYAPQGWTFYPFSLVILTLLSLAMLYRHLGLTAMIVEIAVLVTVFIIQGGQVGSVRASLRFLVMMTLAVPLFLLATWQGDLYRENVSNPAFLNQTALLIAGGFALWLAAAPMHGWLSAIAVDSQPGIAAFVFITFPNVAMAILLGQLAQSPWLVEIPHAQEIIVVAGLAGVLVGGIFGSAQNAFGPLLGYTALFDLGCSLAALGLGSQTGLTIIMYAVLVRVIALTLIGLCIAFIQYQSNGTSFEDARGLAHYWPVPVLGLIIGGATIAGAPLTAGFVSKWLLLQPLTRINPLWPVAILLGSLGITISYLRCLSVLLDAPPRPLPPPAQKRRFNALIIGLIILCIGIGLYPQTAIHLAQQLARSLNIPVL